MVNPHIPLRTCHSAHATALPHSNTPRVLVRRAPGCAGASSSYVELVAEYQRATKNQTSWWYKVAKLTQNSVGSALVLLTVAAVVTPIGMKAFNPLLSANILNYLPRGDPGVSALNVSHRCLVPTHRALAAVVFVVHFLYF